MSINDDQPRLPIPISMVGDKFLLFDIDTITWLRREHQICGVMGGTLPQSPSQNVFLGLPMQIMPEEAQLLVEKQVGYIVDDHYAHDRATRTNDPAQYADYMAQIRRKAEAASNLRAEQREQLRQHALSKQKAKKQKPSVPSAENDKVLNSKTVDDDIEADSALFNAPSSEGQLQTPSSTTDTFSCSMTPTTSTLLLHPTSQPPPSTKINSSSAQNQIQIPNLPASYPLYRHLNSKSYFSTPGLRFGCQYCVYPGDPLRFHSHFLAVGVGWQEEIDLMDIVGGGRLGTGVKKAWLLGGLEPASDAVDGSGSTAAKGNGTEATKGKVRTFSIEWAAM